MNQLLRRFFSPSLSLISNIVYHVQEEHWVLWVWDWVYSLLLPTSTYCERQLIFLNLQYVSLQNHSILNIKRKHFSFQWVFLSHLRSPSVQFAKFFANLQEKMGVKYFYPVYCSRFCLFPEAARLAVEYLCWRVGEMCYWFW